MKIKKKRKLDPSVIRCGDMVRIKNWRVVHRVGYPKTIEDYLPEVEKRLGPALRTAFGDIINCTPLGGLQNKFFKIERAAAKLLAEHDEYGGRRRNVHFKEWPGSIPSDESEYLVYGIRFAKTGVYVPASSYGTYDGYEYDPAYLSQEKTVKLLTLSIGHEVLADDVEKILPIQEDDEQ